VQKTRVLYYDVLINYVAQQNPDVLAKMTALPKTFDTKALEVINAQVTPELMKWLHDQPQLFFAATYCSMLDNLQQTPASGADPPWRNEARAFKDLFDQHSVAALEIFRPLNDVLEDAQRFSRYAQESDRCPLAIQARDRVQAETKIRMLKEAKDSNVLVSDAVVAAAAAAAGEEALKQTAMLEAFRAALACESCADSLVVARADILGRLSELAANYAAIQGLYQGEGRHSTYAVPWKLWLLPMAYWAAVMLAFHGLAFAFLLSMRKVWVEAERLPFPYAILPERLERGVPPGPGVPDQQSVFPRWWLYIPFLIGLGLCLPHFWDISEHSINPPPPNPLNNTKDLSVEGWDIRLNMDTWVLALLLLFPLDLLFTALFFFFIGAYAVPYLAKLCGIEGFGQNLIPYQMLRMGGFLGLFLGTVWFNRRTMWQLVTGRVPRESTGQAGRAEQEAAARDPVPGKFLTVLFWTCLLLLAMLLLWGETGGGLAKVVLFLFGLFVVVVYNFQEWRIRAEGGFVAWDFNNIMKVQTWSNWNAFGLHHTNPDHATQLPLPQNQMAWQQLYNTGLLGTYVPTLGPGSYFLEAFRVGDLFRASPKAILKAALMAFLIALVVGMPIYLACTYHYGLGRESMSSIWFNFGHSSDKIFRYYMKRGDGGPFGTASSSLSGFAYLQEMMLGNNWRNSFLWTVAGAIVVIVLMYYRRNVARFPFNPVGFVIAGTGSSGMYMDISNIWFAFLVAFLIKWVIHDWFGVRLFRTKVEPGITYLMLGLCTGVLVYVVLVVLRLHFGVTWLEHTA
ncbi:MAG TPA: DUF6785 family protein, partial [Planctomycetota bacterium]|nr:DUF6785 family protein [Planctomycetota bacterium]